MAGATPSGFMICMTDTMRMGGEFELNPALFCRAPDQAAPTLPTPFSCWTDTGRSALLIAGKDILRSGGKPVVWLPAFCCVSVATAFQQSGFTLNYYTSSELHGEASVEPSPQPGETLLFVHYFGHRNHQRVMQADRCRRDGVHVVEDCAQAALTEGVGATGHYAVTSLRKFLPQPDGALLGAQNALPVDLADADEAFVSARALAKLLRGTNVADECFLSLFEESEARLDESSIVPREISWLSRQLMSRTDLADIAMRRRRNHQSLFRALLDHLPSVLNAVLADVDRGEVPLGLPVRVTNGRRDALRGFLASQSVFCPIHWNLPHLPRTAESAADHLLASEILPLPIDQRMGDLHIQRLIRLLQKFFADNS